MEYKVFKENEKLNLTPEKKLETWKNIILKKLEEGMIIRVYSDIESTGLEFSPRGRPLYDPVLDNKKLSVDSMKFNIPLETLIEETKELAGKSDRMIEIAMVFCYENENGETYLLKDDEGEPIYFHEMVFPSLLEDKKNFAKMPLVPYEIHKTSMEFLKGEEEHPILKIKLNKRAPDTSEVLTEMLKFFEYPEDKNHYFRQVKMFFHNGDKFDVPFINCELYRIKNEPLYLRDFVQIYDTYDLSKEIIPNDVQKFFAYCQTSELLGGDESIKNDKDKAINGTQKTVDNIVRIAKYIANNEAGERFERLSTWQSNYYKKIHALAKENNETEWEGLLQYICHEPIINTDILTGAPQYIIDSEIGQKYTKFRTSVEELLKVYTPVQNEKIVKNFLNSKSILKERDFLNEALERINGLSRDAHGARVDSQLFMDAFMIIENILYPKSKVNHDLKREIDESDIKIDFEAIKKIKLKRGI